MKVHGFLRAASVLAFVLSAATWAQVNMGTISGTVKDSSGALLPGAKILILNEQTGISRTVESGSEGRYSAPALSLGNYRVTGSHEGFKTEVRDGIQLTVGSEETVDLTLSAGATTQTVEVTGEAPLVETTTASLGALVDDRTIRALPLNGRSYDQLALLQPGVALTDPDEALSASSFINGTGKRFSVGGQRSNANSFLLDGTSISDQANGTPGGAAGTNLGVDTIEEFKIFTNSFDSEYGRVSGSVTSAVTRTGTNDLHGTGFEYIRNSAVDARNYFDLGSSPPPFRRNQFGGVLGGPIVKDRTFFFTGYEGLRQALGTSMEANVPDALSRQGILPTGTFTVNPASVPYINLYPVANGPDLGGGVAEYFSTPTTDTNEDNAMFRIDHKLNNKTGIFGRYTYDQDGVTSPLSIPPQVLTLSSRRQYTTLQANTVLSSRAFNNFRFAYNRSFSFGNVTGTTALELVPGQPFGTLAIGNNTGNGGSSANIIAQIAGGGKGNGIFQWAYNLFEWGDDFSYLRGKHSFRAGVDVERLLDNNIRTVSVRGSLTFTTFNTLLAGTPSQFQAAYPFGENPHYAIRQTLVGGYGQDDYRLSSRVIVNLGLRWEITTNPYDKNGTTSQLPSVSATAMLPSSSYFTIAKKNLEPRLGLTWQLNNSGKTVVRTGGGIYHDQILPWLFPNQTQNPPNFATLTATNPPFPNPVNAFAAYTSLSSVPAGIIALNIIAPAQKVPTAYQYNLSLQQQLSQTLVVQVSYAGGLSRYVPMLKEADTFTPIFCTTTPSSCPSTMLPGQPPIYYPGGTPRLNTEWSSIRWGQDNGNAEYNSGTVMLRRQSPKGLVGQIYYTFAKVMDQLSNLGASDSLRSPSALMDPFNRKLDWGPSEFDLSQAAIANFSYPVPLHSDNKLLGSLENGWTFDGIGSFEAGLPFTARLASSQSKDGSAVLADRPNLNSGSSTNPTHGSSRGCSGLTAGTALRSVAHWYDPCAFTLPISGTYGNLKRDTMIGPPIDDIDMAVEKTAKFNERATATLRFEMFNILNHANFGLPNTVALTSTGAASPTAGQITYTTTTSRQLQLALRLSF